MLAFVSGAFEILWESREARSLLYQGTSSLAPKKPQKDPGFSR
jgi:hypothetical protein